MQHSNIDRLCAEVGFSIPEVGKDKSAQENMIQKSLGVLSQDGIFAYLVWLESKNSLNPGNDPKDSTAKKIHEKSYDLLKHIGFVGQFGGYRYLKEELVKPNGILEDIHQMFLVKQLLERMLTYALYKVKSFKKSEA